MNNPEVEKSDDWEIPAHRVPEPDDRDKKMIPLKMTPMDMGESTREIQPDGRVLLT